MSDLIWQSLNWDCHENIKAGFTYKNDQYPQSFNLAKHAFDKDKTKLISQVEANRSKLKEYLSIDQPIIWLNQTHSNRCVKADVENLGSDADASFSANNQSICAVLTADCLPIFLADKSGKEVAMVHGGWKGLLNGVIENAVLEFKSKQLQAYLGPAIGVNSFEVGDEVKALFLEKSSDFKAAFAPNHAPKKTMANIYQIAKVILNKLGIEDIQSDDYCTVKDASLFSYRAGDVTGRMAHLIWLQK